MNASIQTQIEQYRSLLQRLIQRGAELRKLVASSPGDSSIVQQVRSWQEACGAAVNQLSGGSKAHWLARAFSEAFLMRSSGGAAIESVSTADIVQRLLDVLNQATASIDQLDADASGSLISTATQPTSAAPRRFDFVHNRDLRLVLEQAFIEGRRALDQGSYGRALLVSAGILETIVFNTLIRQMRQIRRPIMSPT